MDTRLSSTVAAFGLNAKAKHLRILYVYFWRWAAWKVFDHDPNANTGMGSVCYGIRQSKRWDLDSH